MARGRGGGRSHNIEPVNNPRPDPMQQLFEMMTQQQAIMRNLQEEVRELREERNANREQPEGPSEENSEENPEGEQPVNTEQSQAVPPSQEVPVVPVREENGLQYWMPKFIKYQPPAFRGKFDAQAAEDWLIRMEKIFEVLGCPTEVQAKMAIYKLEGDADRWWKNTTLILNARNIPLTWEVFQKKFNEKYFPKSVKIEKEKEFLAIRQGDDETFDEYLARFTRLSRYSSYLKDREDEEWCSDMLIGGLKPEMEEKLVAREFTEFNKTVEVCRLTESNMKRARINKNASIRTGSSQGNAPQKRKGPESFPRGSNKKPFQPERSGYQGRLPPRPCSLCHKVHSGRACNGQYLCHACKKPGHFIKDCPQLSQLPQRPAEPRPQNQGRVFALTHEEAQKSPEMIQGTLLLHGRTVHTLFDSGASHSFIAYDCVKRLGLCVYKLPYDLNVLTPLGVKTVTADVCLNCVISVEGHESVVDLICLPLQQLEVILGLNWLSANNVLLECGSKRVIFPEPQAKLDACVSLNFLSVAEAEKCLEKGCQGYMVFLSVQAETGITLENIPVVNEFPDVFPEDISGLPPEREVEFAIETMPGTGSVSKAPYRMAPNEMLELKKQIEELLEKGFIRPSVSP